MLRATRLLNYRRKHFRRWLSESAESVVYDSIFLCPGILLRSQYVLALRTDIATVQGF
jgi:hypothetical protein